MHRMRILRSVLAALALTIAVALLATGGSNAAPSKPQRLFEKTLLADSKTMSAIKALLREDGGFVAPDIEFADLTGDGRSDAIALVDTGGLAGAIALYVISTHGRSPDSALRVLYSSQWLYRASIELVNGGLTVRTPRYAEGDDVCCPRRVLERAYAWSASNRTLRLRSSDEVAGPD